VVQGGLVKVKNGQYGTAGAAGAPSTAVFHLNRIPAR
jgi:hypothetical protein